MIRKSNAKINIVRIVQSNVLYTCTCQLYPNNIIIIQGHQTGLELVTTIFHILCTLYCLVVPPPTITMLGCHRKTTNLGYVTNLTVHLCN